MEIRHATRRDLSRLVEIYASAREYMRETGNPNQWKSHYPPRELTEEDIATGRLYVCTEGEEILGVFVYLPGPDPTYAVIEEGGWLNDRPYGVMHRVAVAKHGCGVARFCFDFCYAHCRNLRIDTHAENRPMQSALRKAGFVRCGIIHLLNGEPRVAFQKCED